MIREKILGEKMDEIRNAVKSYGKAVQVAKALGISRALMSRWVRLNRIPPKRAVEFSKLTGLPLHICNPEVFPKPEIGENDE